MRRLCTGAWLVRHAVTVALVAAFLALGWWQISRAAAGNTLSWAYAVEWPVFAGFVVFLWVREVRQALREERPPRKAEPPGPSGGTPGIRRPVRPTRARLGPADASADDDSELAAYNHYLAWLNANPEARPGDYPG